MLYIVKGCLDGLVVSITFILSYPCQSIYLVPLTKGIYPTIIIIIVALHKSKVEQECMLPNTQSMRFTPPSRLSMQVSFATHTSETVDYDPRRDTVVLTGLSPPGSSNTSFDLANKQASEEDIGTEA